MDPITLILGALAGGAASALQETVSQAVKDGYRKLRELVGQRLRERDGGELVLSRYLEEPEIWRTPLQAELRAVGAERDEAILHAARTLIALGAGSTVSAGRFVTHIEGGVQGLVQGDRNEVTISFPAAAAEPHGDG